MLARWLSGGVRVTEIPNGWKASDSDPLRLECERCGFRAWSSDTITMHACAPVTIMMRGGLVDPSIFTDDQLRDECKRRGIGHVSEPMCTVAERNNLQSGLLVAAREAADWKRLAEERHGPTGWTISSEATWETHGQRVEFIDGDRRMSMPVRLLIAAAARYSSELGPGIAATKPDNNVAWLDEDLLCEDA